MVNNTQQEIIRLFTETPDVQTLKNALGQYHPYDLAQAFLALDESKQELYYQIFTNEELAEIFSYLDSEDSSDILETIDAAKAAPILTEMEPDDATDVLQEIEDQKAKAIYDLLAPDTKSDIQELAQYSENTAGALMNSHFLKFKSGSDIRDAMKILVRDAPNVETIDTGFIVDHDDRLLGTIGLKQLIIAKAPKVIDEIMNTNFQAVNTEDSLETVINAIRNYDILEMPVLDNGIIKGIITMNDALKSYVEEAEDDFAMLGGLTESEEADESITQSIAKRLPWLAGLLILDIFVTIIVASFDFLFVNAALTVLAFFQPNILGLAGNSGTQSLAVAIQKITRKELEEKSAIFRHIGREVALGIASGLILGILAMIFSIVLLYAIKEDPTVILRIGIVVGTAVFLSLAASNLFGAMIPIVLYKMKLDPAAASGPFITSIIDIIAVAIYFTLAALLLYYPFL